MQAMSGWSSLKLLVVVAFALALSSNTAQAQSYDNIGADGTVFGPMTSNVRSVVGGSNLAMAGTMNVAIVASAANDVAAPWFTDPQNRLAGSGQFATVTVINAGATTPTLADLNQFDAVMVWSNLAFADATTLGDNLADYVDGGGSVVVAVFANSSTSTGRALAGRWQTGNYEIIPTASGNTTGAATIGTIDDSGHPIMAGVSTFAGGSSSFRPTTTSLPVEATRVAAWDDGSTLVAERNDKVGRRIDLGFYPPSDVVQADFWDSTTNGDDLLVNAMLYATTSPLVPSSSQWGLACLSLTILSLATVILRQRAM